METPRGLSDWQKTPSGSKDREAIPAHVFLGANRTYPVKVWRDGKWVYSERMLRAAISRANSQKRPDISARASRILRREFGDD